MLQFVLWLAYLIASSKVGGKQKPCEMWQAGISLVASPLTKSLAGPQGNMAALPPLARSRIPPATQANIGFQTSITQNYYLHKFSAVVKNTVFWPLFVWPWLSKRGLQNNQGGEGLRKQLKTECGSAYLLIVRGSLPAGTICIGICRATASLCSVWRICRRPIGSLGSKRTWQNTINWKRCQRSAIGQDNQQVQCLQNRYASLFHKRNESYPNGKRIKAMKQSAVQQFAAQYNAKQHDKVPLSSSKQIGDHSDTYYLTIIPWARVGYEMIDR